MVMSIGDLYMLRYKKQDYCMRVIFNHDRDTSLVCQFFLPDGHTLALEVQFTYNFLMRYDDKLFNYPAIYSDKSSISFGSVRPFVRFSLEKLKEKADDKLKETLFKVSSYEDKHLLDLHERKPCIHFLHDTCKIADSNDDAEGRTTDGACADCEFPENFERCEHLLNGKTKGLIEKGKITRNYFRAICRKNNAIDNVLDCRFGKKQCFVPPDLEKQNMFYAIKSIIVSSRCKEFESDRLILRRLLEEKYNARVLLIPESDEDFPDKSKVEDISITKAYDSDIYILLVGNEYGDIIEKEFNAAMESTKHKEDKEILIYVKGLKSRHVKTEEFIKRLKNISTLKDFNNITDLEEKIISRLNKVLSKK